MRSAETADGWSRNRLLAIVASLGVAATLVVAGFGYAVYRGVRSSASGTPPSAQSTLSRPQMNSKVAHGSHRRDQIAAQPMLSVPPEAMKPTTPTTQLAQPIRIPEATSTGPAGVPTGFPHTPSGAVGQLSALSVTVLDTMSVATTHAVYADWAMPGGVGADRWAMATNVTSFLGAAAMGPSKTPGTTISAVPLGAQVKGTDGPNWTVACVLFEVDATISQEASIAYAYCQRMQWNDNPGAPAGPAEPGVPAGPGVPAEPGGRAGSAGGRWMIAPGTPPAPAPNTWPGTALALKAGWRTWATTASENTTIAATDRGPAGVDTAAAHAPDNPSGDPLTHPLTVPTSEPTSEPTGDRADTTGQTMSQPAKGRS